MFICKSYLLLTFWRNHKIYGQCSAHRTQQASQEHSHACKGAFQWHQCLTNLCPLLLLGAKKSKVEKIKTNAISHLKIGNHKP